MKIKDWPNWLKVGLIFLILYTIYVIILANNLSFVECVIQTDEGIKYGSCPFSYNVKLFFQNNGISFFIGSGVIFLFGAFIGLIYNRVRYKKWI